MVNGFFRIMILVTVLVVSSCGTTDLNDPGTNDDASKFLGTWNVSDQPARINYVVKIQRSVVASDKVILDNFGDLGGSATGLVVGNAIVIDQQNIGGGFSAEGTGDYISENKLQFEFTLDDGIDKEQRKAIFTK